jgi:hypothetical protein
MFMPFDLEPPPSEDSIPYADVLKDYMQSIGYEFGILFYRHRIAEHAATALRLIAEGETQIERHKDLRKIVSWIEIYSQTLQTL